MNRLSYDIRAMNARSKIKLSIALLQISIFALVMLSCSKEIVYTSRSDFSVWIPEGWSEIENIDLSIGNDGSKKSLDILMVYSPFENDQDLYSESFVIEFFELSRPMDLNEFRHIALKSFTDNDVDFTLEKEGKAVIDGYPAIWTDMIVNQAGKCLRVQSHFIFVCDNLGYMLSFNAECKEYAKYTKQFQSVLSSFDNFRKCDSTR